MTGVFRRRPPQFLFSPPKVRLTKQPASYTFGNQGVGLVRGPGVINLNMSLIRTFRFMERYQLQFRGESFNLANHANFATPGRVFEGPGYGIISAARAARQIQVGMRLTF